MKARIALLFAGVALAAAAIGIYFGAWHGESKLPFARPASPKPMPELTFEELLAIVPGPPPVRRVFEITALDDRLDLVESSSAL